MWLIYLKMKYILASASPRRKELFSLIVPEFEQIASQGEEKFNMSLFPEKVACSVAEGKCDEVFSAHPDCVVIGCDTIVIFEGQILGKPKDEEDAFNTLKRLSGKTHFVITAVCVRTKHKKLLEFEKTEVEGDASLEIRAAMQAGAEFKKAFHKNLEIL